MSAYKCIRCDIVDKGVLIEALKELGLEAHVHDTPQPLKGYMGDLRNQKAEIIVPKDIVNAKFTGASNDLGFVWDEANKKYLIVCSEYDERMGVHQRVLQAYAKIAIERALEAQRFNVKSSGTHLLQGKKRTKVNIVATKVV